MEQGADFATLFRTLFHTLFHGSKPLFIYLFSFNGTGGTRKVVKHLNGKK
jgi:hypothetical protein